MALHSACRNRQYLVPSGDSVVRLHVPDGKVSWLVPWPSYKPPTYTLPGLSTQPRADPEIGSHGFYPRWNKDQDGINRESLVRVYDVRKGYPLNPCGRTGLRGRGRLGRWGPNHAVDAVVTSWKRSDTNDKVMNPETGLPVLQFVAMKHRNTGDWALPGGMVDQGESASDAVKRKFLEEALNRPNVEAFFASEQGENVKALFDHGQVVYEGYIDDPRNTDNSWMESTAFLFHDNDGNIAPLLEIEGGDDASMAQWVDISKELRLYASHSDVIKEVVSLLGAHW